MLPPAVHVMFSVAPTRHTSPPLGAFTTTLPLTVNRPLSPYTLVSPAFSTLILLLFVVMASTTLHAFRPSTLARPLAMVVGYVPPPSDDSLILTVFIVPNEVH